MKLSRINLPATLYWFFLFAFFCVSTLFVAFRDFTVGADTERYAIYFERVAEGFHQSRYEPLFEALTYGITVVSDSVSFFFAVVFILFNIFYFYGPNRFSNFSGLGSSDRLLLVVLLVALCLSSSWYFTASVNGLRHGLSLAFMYSALMLGYERKYLFCLVFYLVAVGFHYSLLLIFPFLIFCFVPFRWSVFIFLTISFMYPLGWNELLIKEASGSLNLGLYEKLSGYADDRALWVGFQWEFFLYSLFWFIFFIMLLPFVKDYYLLRFKFLVRSYAFLLLPYMVFGFGGFSNRYAFIAWLFLPIIQSFAIVMLRIDYISKFSLGWFFLLVGLFFYSYRFEFFI